MRKTLQLWKDGFKGQVRVLTFLSFWGLGTRSHDYLVLDEHISGSDIGNVLIGIAGTPYEGGYFRIRFEFGPEYPNLPPKCMSSSTLSPCGHKTEAVGTMMTRIFHPNVSKAGEICVDTLKKSWNKKYGVGHVLVVCPSCSMPTPCWMYAMEDQI